MTNEKIYSSETEIVPLFPGGLRPTKISFDHSKIDYSLSSKEEITKLMKSEFWAEMYLRDERDDFSLRA